MYRFTFAVDAIGEDSPKALEMARQMMLESLEALVRIDQIYLKYDPRVPLLYESGVRYDRTTPPPGSSCGDDDWQDLVICLRRRYGDCEDLACWRVAELRERFHVKAVPHLWLRLSEGRMGRKNHEYHILVEWPGNLRAYPSTVFDKGGKMLEDPSQMLGMNAPKGW